MRIVDFREARDRLTLHQHGVLGDHDDDRLFRDRVGARLWNAHPVVVQHLHVGRVHQQERHHHRENVDEGYQVQMCIEALAALVRHQPETQHFHGASPSAMLVNSATFTVCGEALPGTPLGAAGGAAPATSGSAAGNSTLRIASIAWISSSYGTFGSESTDASSEVGCSRFTASTPSVSAFRSYAPLTFGTVPIACLPSLSSKPS